MLDKLFSDEKIFRIFTFFSIIILFFIVLKKNKKEKFSFTKPSAGSEKMAFKESMQEAFGDNFQAIKNLSDVAAQITSSSNPGELTLNKLLINDGGTNVNVLDTIKFMQGAITTKENIADVDRKLEGKLNTSSGRMTGNLQVNTINNIKPARWLKDRESLFHLTHGNYTGKDWTGGAIGLHRNSRGTIEWAPQSWKIARSRVWTDPTY